MDAKGSSKTKSGTSTDTLSNNDDSRPSTSVEDVMIPAINEQHDDNDLETGPNEGDLIIRNGFPALYTPASNICSKTRKPNLTEDEFIPRHTFWSTPDAIQFHPDHLETLRQDCETVFTARDRPDGVAYSAGQTFFIPSNQAPRCALEALALLIFRKHTQHLPPGTFHPATSGANWWTLVMDPKKENHEKTANTDDDDDEDEDEEEEEDEVGLHFDADYELEEQTTNLLLHPRVGTVTYLSDYGVPTAIFNLPSPPMDDVERKSLERTIDKAWLSHPQIGKHTAFDGRLLHGAPAMYFPSRTVMATETAAATTSNSNEGNDQPPAKRQKVVSAEQIGTKRYTLLVNVWLNHWVMDAALLDDEVCAKLQTPWQDPNVVSNLKRDDDSLVPPPPPFTWNPNVHLFKPCDIPAKITLKPSSVDPAGEDEIALCNHIVTVKYNPLMAECHQASLLASTVELELETNAIHLEVGEMLAKQEEDDDKDKAR
jgi:hypothetical protein